MDLNIFLDNEWLSKYNSLMHLLNAKIVSIEGEVNLINDSLLYSTL